jgi:hypothetical protein
VGSGRFRRDPEDQAHVEVRDEEPRRGAAQNHDTCILIVVELSGDTLHVEVQRPVEQVDRRLSILTVATPPLTPTRSFSYPS